MAPSRRTSSAAAAVKMISGNIEQAMISQSTAPLPLNLNRASAYAADDAEQQGQDRRRAGHDDRVDQ